MTNNYSRFYIILVVIITAMCGTLFGYDTGVIADALIFIKKDYVLNIVQQETLVALVPCGALLGALCCGALNDKIGRRHLLLITALAFIIGTLLCTFATNITLLMIGRFIVGVAVGISSFSAPLYISEIAPSQIRGSLVIINTVTVTGGILLAYILDYFLAKYSAWHAMFGLGLIPAIILALGVLFLPGSPRWLIQKDQHHEAKRVLQKLRGNNNVDSEIQEIEHIINIEKNTNSKIKLTPYLPLLIIGIVLAVIQQISGINAILYYAPELFQSIFLHSTSAPLLATIAVGSINFLTTIIAMLLIDRVGRRPLLLTGLISMALSLLILSLTLALNIKAKAIPEVMLILLLFYIASYAISIGCIFWLLIAEIYPLQIRGKAMGIAAASNWAANLLVSITALSLITALGLSTTLMFYAIAGLLSYMFCYFYIPETKKLSLEKIELNLSH